MTTSAANYVFEIQMHQLHRVQIDIPTIGGTGTPKEYHNKVFTLPFSSKRRGQTVSSVMAQNLLAGKKDQTLSFFRRGDHGFCI
jgi:hypothetical protein